MLKQLRGFAAFASAGSVGFYWWRFGGLVMLRTLLTGMTLAFVISAAHAADSLQLTCSGDMIEPAGLARAPKALTAVFSPANRVSKVSVDFGQGSVNAPVSSNNPVQLQFRTKDFTGEYFHYTRDMFLIHKSGHLARLTCKPNG
jgi:hypothetical protein